MNREELRKLQDMTSMIAAILSNYFQELIKCGFTEEQAMILTLDFQEITLSAKPDKPGNPDNE